MEYKKVITYVLMLALVVLALPVSAKEATSSLGLRASTTERREEIKNKIEDHKASSTERKASSTDRRIEMQRSLAKRKAEYTARVLTATVRRLEKIATRLDSRIAKVDAAHGTTTDAKIFVAEARRHLALASSTIATFVSLNFSGDKAQENFEKVRTLATEVKGHIRDAHENLMKATRALKGPQGEDHATSTSKKSKND